MPSERFRITMHPECYAELQALARRGLKFEDSIGRTLARIDDLFGDLDPSSDRTARQNWELMPIPVPSLHSEQDLRCIDPDDGLITLVARVQADVLYLLSADLSTRNARYRATQRAAERTRNLDWADPE
jgi:hypothetical protein